MFVSLASLWLPTLLAAVFVFIVSSIIHMALPYHKNDYRGLPDEPKVLDALRSVGVTTGPVYMFPYHSMKDMKSPEVQEKFKRGPNGLLHITPTGMPSMGKFLTRWFILCLVLSFFVAYLTSRTRTPGAEFLEVFRVAGTIGFLAYGGAQAQQSIWGGQIWSVTCKHIFDALIYGLVTGATFGWLWPH